MDGGCLALFDNSLSDCVFDQLDAGLEAKFPHEAGAMRFNGPAADFELVGYIYCGLAVDG